MSRSHCMLATYMTLWDLAGVSTRSRSPGPASGPQSVGATEVGSTSPQGQIESLSLPLGYSENTNTPLFGESNTHSLLDFHGFSFQPPFPSPVLQNPSFPLLKPMTWDELLHSLSFSFLVCEVGFIIKPLRGSRKITPANPSAQRLPNSAPKMSATIIIHLFMS